MASIVTYDILEKHVELKRALLDLGYNVTMCHCNKTPDEAAIDVQNICEKLDIRLEKCIATDMINWFIFLDDFYIHNR
jgi:hypothetical protein